MDSGYDIIGDVHGHADKLHELLRTLGYEEQRGVFRHSRRRALFVGDLIDRGPQQRATVETVRAMVEAGSARMVLGNHEVNAIAYATPDGRGDYVRPHLDSQWGAKNERQHAAFLHEYRFDSPAYRDVIAWFQTLPLWLEVDGLRLVHACWHEASIATLREAGVANGIDTADKVRRLHEPGEVNDALEVVCKGPEVPLPPDAAYLDKDGICRDHARVKWWVASPRTLRELCLAPADLRACSGGAHPGMGDIPAEQLAPYSRYAYATDAVPVFYGHYWFTGVPAPTGENSACLDYSAGKGGPLVAYRWSGEATLRDDHFVSAR